MDAQRKYVTEFIGTFFLVFTVGMAVALDGAMTALAIGSSLMVMVYAGGHISGGHFNPAVSAAVYLRGKLTQGEMIGYWVAQIAGGVIAAVIVLVLGKDPASAMDIDGTGRALIVEFLFTFALCYVVLNVATADGTDGNSFYGLAIGFTVFVGAVAVGSISGGAFNPAVAIGAVVFGLFKLSTIWIYLVANLLGAAAAAAVFRYQIPEAEHRTPEGAVSH